MCAIQGDKINHSEYFIDLLTNEDTKNYISDLYPEKVYGPNYKITLLIHAIRNYIKNYSSVTKQNKPLEKVIVKLIDLGATISETDSKGIDSLMYAVESNNLQLVRILVEHFKNQINRNLIDNNGKSIIHYVIAPNEEGSYENTELLKYLLDTGFNPNLKDINGKTPIDYAVNQVSGVNLKILSKFVKLPSTQLERKLSYISSINWKFNQYNYEQDSQSLIDSKHAEFGHEKYSEQHPDPHSNFPLKTHSLYKDDTNGYWDLTMTKVDISNGTYGEYLFYKMQLVYDSNRKLYILWTRWGRIGESGDFQQTPFPDVNFNLIIFFRLI